MDPKDLERLKEERQKMHEEANSEMKESISVQQAQATALELAEAILSPESLECLLNATLTANNPAQAAVYTTPLQGFPTEGTSFAVLSNGNAAQIAGPASNFCSTCYNPIGVGEYDTVTLNLQFLLSSTPGNLTFDWKFGTEENPRARVDFFNVLVNGTPIPGFPVTPQDLVLAPPNPNDVCFNSINPTIQTTSFDLSPFANQVITVSFQVADTIFDCFFDSAAFIDNLAVEGCVETNCALCDDTVNFCSSVIVPPNFTIDTASAQVGFETNCLQCVLEPCFVNLEIPTPCGGPLNCDVDINSVRAVGCIPFYVSVVGTHNQNGSTSSFCSQGAACVDNVICSICLEGENPCAPGFFDATTVNTPITVRLASTDTCGNRTYVISGTFQLPSC